MTNQTIAKHALAFARRRFRVLPCQPKGKAPYGNLVRRGALDASADPETIANWFTVLAPAANLGVALSGHVVLDIDPRNDGDVSLRALEARSSPLPRTWRSLTGGGGEHIWFVLPPGTTIRGGNDKLGRGIDVKTGAGSYVVAPPSITHARYEWRREYHPAEMPLSELPQRLIVLLSPPPPPLPASRPSVGSNDDDRIIDALARIRSDDRETWLRVGMALRSHYGDDGRTLWDAWSATSVKHDAAVQGRIWRSFRGSGVNIATVFHLARGGQRVA